jgi:hypothetical protein
MVLIIETYLLIFHHHFVAGLLFDSQLHRSHHYTAVSLPCWIPWRPFERRGGLRRIWYRSHVGKVSIPAAARALLCKECVLPTVNEPLLCLWIISTQVDRLHCHRRHDLLPCCNPDLGEADQHALVSCDSWWHAWASTCINLHDSGAVESSRVENGDADIYCAVCSGVGYTQARLAVLEAGVALRTRRACQEYARSAVRALQRSPILSHQSEAKREKH